ncbi:transmembrane amino acid transporter protein-domain-containing protein [Radiomyces spectabilis]|uniref:transmembrane amino acid transporter protein-domain-containing protein n=1 Tax=Radiomyces spectabilis TaxID=64574 RepID=UPI00221FE8A4|nr:transmembrane amino acid transporter protein-domain-containing protein [Radiomyces spectabilis]KAI8388455.1 transmembrane amino acid transporter protein-domain-containing protein [Radiomyces spectabilis]
MTFYGSVPNKHHHLLTKAERDLLQADRPGYGSRTRLEVAFNLVNATVGAGIIGLPFAVAHAGFFLGVAASIFVAILSQTGLYMLIVAGQRVGIYKFALLVEYLLGRPGYHFLNLMIFIQAGGAAVSYFILLGDTVTVLCQRYLPQFSILSDRSIIVPIIGLCCILPLTTSRSIGSLARWSTVAVFTLPVILLSILIRAPAYAPDTHIPLTWFGSDIFGALGIMAFAFTCSQVAFNNYLTLEDQTAHSWRQTTTISSGISWLASMTFAIIGFLCFGENVQSNLFMNFAPDDPVVNIGRLALGLNMVLSIPVAFFPTREAVQKSLGFETATKQPTTFQHYIVTIVLFVILLITGVTVKSLGKVYALVGGVSATTLAFILPACAYLVTRRRTATSTDVSVYPTLTASTAVSPMDEDKSPLVFSDVASFASSSRTPIFDEEDVSTVDNYEMLDDDELPEPSFWLDIAAGLLIVWGFMVMVFSTSGVLTQS